MRRLNEIGTLCAKDGFEVDTCLNEILNVAIERCGADKGNIELYEAGSERRPPAPRRRRGRTACR
jgi:hypothetical protein